MKVKAWPTGDPAHPGSGSNPGRESPHAGLSGCGPPPPDSTLAAEPVVGGILGGLWSWRGIFWFSTWPSGWPPLVVAAVILPENADPAAARVDTAGTLLGAGALAAFVFAIIDSESAGFGSAEAIALMCASAVLLAAFIWRGAPRRLARSCRSAAISSPAAMHA